MKIIEDKQNPLLKRREIKIIEEAEKNPSMQEAVKKLAEHFKAKEEEIAIKQIKGKFGRNTFLITANIYNNKEDREKIEPKLKAKRGKEEVEQEAQKQEAGKEATEEKPAEKKPEEKSKESKKEEVKGE